MESPKNPKKYPIKEIIPKIIKVNQYIESHIQQDITSKNKDKTYDNSFTKYNESSPCEKKNDSYENQDIIMESQ